MTRQIQLPYQPQSENESKIVEAIIPLEFGVHDWEHDRGGPTAHGITEERAADYGISVADVTPEIARAIIADYYYCRPKFDQLPDIRLKYRMTLDGLHSGCEGRVIMLQQILNTANKQGRKWADIKTDGAIGPVTLQALRLHRADSSGMSDNLYYLRLCARLCMLQGAVYHRIMLRDQTQEEYERGWYNRLINQPEWYEFGGLHVH